METGNVFFQVRAAFVNIIFGPTGPTVSKREKGNNELHDERKNESVINFYLLTDVQSRTHSEH
jgi:hypothetical protein